MASCSSRLLLAWCADRFLYGLAFATQSACTTDGFCSVYSSCYILPTQALSGVDSSCCSHVSIPPLLPQLDFDVYCCQYVDRNILKVATFYQYPHHTSPIQSQAKKGWESTQVTFWAPAAAGGGVTLVMAYLNGTHIPNLLRFRTLLTKALGAALAVPSGLAIGPEAPMVHIGACIASNITYANCAVAKSLQHILPWPCNWGACGDDDSSTSGEDEQSEAEEALCDVEVEVATNLNGSSCDVGPHACGGNTVGVGTGRGGHPGHAALWKGTWCHTWEELNSDNECASQCELKYVPNVCLVVKTG